MVGAESGAARRRVPRAGEHGPSDRRPPALRHQASRVRTGPDRRVPTHPTGLRVIGRRDAPRTPRGRVHRDLARRGGGRRVQPAAPQGAPELARGGHPAWHLRLPSSGRSPVQPGARGAHAGQSPRGCATARGTVQCPLRPVTPGRRPGERGPRAAHRSVALGGQPQRGPRAACCPRVRRRDCAHQLLPPRRDDAEALPGVQAGPQPAAVPARTPTRGRDLRLLDPDGGTAPAGGPGGPWRDPVVGPARGLPRRGARVDEGPDGEERGDRAARSQGRVRRQEAPCGDRPGRAGDRGQRLLRHVHPWLAQRDGQPA